MQATTTHQATNTLRTRALGLLRASIILGGVLAPVAFGGMGRAEARVPDNATGSQAEYCRGLQSEYDSLVQELAAARGSEEQRRISRQIAHLQEVWYHRCKPAFGFIEKSKIGPALVNTTGVLTQDDGGSPPPPNVIVRSPLSNAVLAAN